MKQREDFITQYLSYIGETEAPIFYHRWCCLSMIGAYLGRQYHFKLGHFEIYPNSYVMLVGTPGTRKSTAIKIMKKVLTGAGYDKISADRSTKEKFLLDLAGEDSEKSIDDILDSNLWGDSKDPSEMYIACDEFNDFIGNGNVEFISLLGTFWDYTGAPYENRIKNGKSVSINDPTVSILGGNTPVSFARAFPPEILGQGFFSRLLLIHGEPTGKRITFPVPPEQSATVEIIKELQRIKSTSLGRATLTPVAQKLLDKIYKSWKGVDDVRFDSYSNRRFTHLLKLCLIISAARFATSITEADVLYASTILTHTEHLMPKAMGEFGKSKNSDISHKILQILDSAYVPVPQLELWTKVHNDLESLKDLSTIMGNLIQAGKVQWELNSNPPGFLSKKKLIDTKTTDTVDYSLLTEEERNMTK